MAFGFHLARAGRGGEDAERDARNEAAALEAAVLNKGAPRQDNFTCVIVEYS